MTIKELTEKAYANAKEHGFWEDYYKLRDGAIGDGQIRSQMMNNAIATKLMLIVSELAEALEALRHGDEDNFAEELADVAIRLGDLCGGLEIDLEAEIEKKMAKNKSREYKHGKAF